MERELSPISLSIAIPNGSLRKPSAKFDLSKIFLQENDCQSQPPICKVARYPLLLQSFICKNEACTIIDVMAAIKFADASAAKTFGELRGVLSTHITSHFSDKCISQNVSKEEREYKPNGCLSGGHQEEC